MSDKEPTSTMNMEIQDTYEMWLLSQNLNQKVVDRKKKKIVQEAVRSEEKHVDMTSNSHNPMSDAYAECFQNLPSDGTGYKHIKWKDTSRRSSEESMTSHNSSGRSSGKEIVKKRSLKRSKLNSSFEEPIAILTLPPITSFRSDNSLNDMPEYSGGGGSQNEERTIQLLKKSGSTVTVKNEEELKLEMEQEEVLKTIEKQSNLSGSSSVTSLHKPSGSVASLPSRTKSSSSTRNQSQNSGSVLSFARQDSEIADSPIEQDVEIDKYVKKKSKTKATKTMSLPNGFVRKLSTSRRSSGRSKSFTQGKVKIINGQVDTADIARTIMFDIPEDRAITPILARTIVFVMPEDRAVTPILARTIVFVIPETKPIVPELARNFVFEFPDNNLKRTAEGELVYELDEVEGKLLQDCDKHIYLRRSKTEPDSPEVTEFGNIIRRRDTVALLTDLNTLDNKEEKLLSIEDYLQDVRLRRLEKSHKQEKVPLVQRISKVETIPEVSTDVCRVATPHSLSPVQRCMPRPTLHNQSNVLLTPITRMDMCTIATPGPDSPAPISPIQADVVHELSAELSPITRIDVCTVPTPKPLSTTQNEVVGPKVLNGHSGEIIRLLSPMLCGVLSPPAPEIVASSSLAESSTLPPSTRLSMNPSTMSRYKDSVASSIPLVVRPQESQRTLSSCRAVNLCYEIVSDLIQSSLATALREKSCISIATSDSDVSEAEIHEISHRLNVDVLYNAHQDIIKSHEISHQDTDDIEIICRNMISNVLINTKTNLLETYGCTVEDLYHDMSSGILSCTPRTISPDEELELVPEVKIRSPVYKDTINEKCPVLIRNVQDNTVVNLGEEYNKTEEIKEEGSDLSLISSVDVSLCHEMVYQTMLSPSRSSKSSGSVSSFEQISAEELHKVSHNLIVKVLESSKHDVLLEFRQKDKKEHYEMCEMMIQETVECSLRELAEKNLSVVIHSPGEEVRVISISPHQGDGKVFEEELHLICHKLVKDILISEKDKLDKEEKERWEIHEMCKLMITKIITHFETPEPIIVSLERLQPLIAREGSLVVPVMMKSEEFAGKDKSSFTASPLGVMCDVVDLKSPYIHNQEEKSAVDMIKETCDRLSTPEPSPCSFNLVKSSPMVVYIGTGRRGMLEAAQTASPFPIQSNLISSRLNILQQHIEENIRTIQDICSKLSTPTPSPTKEICSKLSTILPTLPSPLLSTTLEATFTKDNDMEKEVAILDNERTQLSSTSTSPLTPHPYIQGEQLSPTPQPSLDLQVEDEYYSPFEDTITPFSDVIDSDGIHSDVGEYGDDTTEEEGSTPGVAILTPVIEETPEGPKIAFTSALILNPIEPEPMLIEPSPPPRSPVKPMTPIFERRAIPNITRTPTLAEESTIPTSDTSSPIQQFLQQRAHTILVASSPECTIVVEGTREGNSEQTSESANQSSSSQSHDTEQPITKKEMSPPEDRVIGRSLWRKAIETLDSPYIGAQGICKILKDEELLEKSTARLADYEAYRRKWAKVTSRVKAITKQEEQKKITIEDVYLRGFTKALPPVELTPQPTSESSDTSESDSDDEENDEALIKILQEIRNITNGNIHELKTYKTPPPEVHDVIKAVYLILGEDPEKLQYWQECAILLGKLGKKHIRRRVLRYKRKKITEDLKNNVTSILEGYTSYNIALKSRVCVLFFIWAKEVCGLNTGPAENPVLPIVMSRFAERSVWSRAGRPPLEIFSRKPLNQYTVEAFKPLNQYTLEALELKKAPLMLSKAVSAFKAAGGIKPQVILSRESTAVQSTM